MAIAGDLPLRSNSGDIQDIQSLLDIFAGKTTTTSSNTTSSGTNSNVTGTQELVDPAKATELISQMLSGTSGLAAISSGSKASGLYNSSTNMLLTNDLLARTAGQVAALSSTKLTASNGTTAANSATNSAVQQQKQADAIKAAVATAVAAALKGKTNTGGKAESSGKGGAGGTKSPDADSAKVEPTDGGPDDPSNPNFMGPYGADANIPNMGPPLAPIQDDPTQSGSLDLGDFDSAMTSENADTQAALDAATLDNPSESDTSDDTGYIKSDGGDGPDGSEDYAGDDGSYDISDFGGDFGGGDEEA